MKTVFELYYFEKFWNILSRQNRSISNWDGERTDMDVFIRRTVGSWFVGKFFQVEVKEHKANIFFLKEFETPDQKTKIFTKYIYITNIRFAYQRSLKVRINYVEPHSQKVEEVYFGWNDFVNISLMENEEDFRILNKFYPVKVEIKQQLNYN